MSGFNGSGLFFFTYSWTNDAANGVPITASRMDTQFNDAVGGFDLCVTRDGQGKMAAAFSPDTDVAYAIGTPAARWLTVYATGFAGTATNNNAASGNVGEYVQSVISVPVALTTGVAANIGSISLDAGDWDVTGLNQFTGDGTTLVKQLVGGINSVSATLPTTGTPGFLSNSFGTTGVALFAQGDHGLTLSRLRVSIASTTTIYLVANSVFTTGTASGYGSITARRVR